MFTLAPLHTPTTLWKFLGLGTPQWAECRDRWRSLWNRAQNTAKVDGLRCLRGEAARNERIFYEKWKWSECLSPPPFVIQWTVQLIVLNLAVYQQIHHLNTLTDCGPQSQWRLSFCVSWLLYMPVIYPFYNIPIRTFQTETRAWDFKSYINIILPFSVYPLRSWHLLICPLFMRG